MKYAERIAGDKTQNNKVYLAYVKKYYLDSENMIDGHIYGAEKYIKSYYKYIAREIQEYVGLLPTLPLTKKLANMLQMDCKAELDKLHSQNEKVWDDQDEARKQEKAEKTLKNKKLHAKKIIVPKLLAKAEICLKCKDTEEKNGKKCEGCNGTGRISATSQSSQCQKEEVEDMLEELDGKLLVLLAGKCYGEGSWYVNICYAILEAVVTKLDPTYLGGFVERELRQKLKVSPLSKILTVINGKIETIKEFVKSAKEYDAKMKAKEASKKKRL